VALFGLLGFWGLLIRPGSWLVLLALVLPFGSLLPSPVAGISVNDIIIVLVAAFWLARGAADREIRIALHPVALSLLPFLWFSALSLLSVTAWREGVAEWLKWAEFWLVLVLVSQAVHRRMAWWIVGALFVAGAAQALIGAYQFLTQSGPPAFAILGSFMRAHGTLRQPNPYAGYLGYIAPVALSLTVAAVRRLVRTRDKKDGLRALVAGAASALLCGGIGLSWSRGGWIALAAAIVVVGVWSARTAPRIATLILVGTLVAALGALGWLPAAVTDRLSDLGNYLGAGDIAQQEITDANFAVLERLAHWRAGLDMFAQHPWLGVGIGNYAAAYGEYAQPHWYEPLGHAHNVVINMLAETGALGTGGFLLFVAAAVIYVWRRSVVAEGYVAALAIGLMGSLAYLTVHSMFDNLFVQHLQLQLALLLGSLIALTTAERLPARGAARTSR
jgi:O-antigen ligase